MTSTRTKPQFQQGEAIRDIHQLVDLIINEQWLWLYGRPKHWTWFDNMSLIVLRRFVRSGNIYRAVATAVKEPAIIDSNFREVDER